MVAKTFEEKNYLLNLRTAEDRYLWTLIGFSLLGHIMFFVIDKAPLFRHSTPLVEEWSIEADIMSDVHISAATKTAIPGAEKNEQESIPENLLPQLPKRFAVEEEKTPDEGDSVADEEKGKDEEKKKVENDLHLRTMELEANKIRMDEALRRLAMEKLRKENKIEKKLQAQEDEAIAKLKTDMAKNENRGAGLELSGLVQDGYFAKLRNHIRQYWSIPESYKEVKIKVVIAVVINPEGKVVKSDVREGSGDAGFDELAYKAVLDAVPLPPPPQGLEGKEIALNFTPQSF